MTDTIILEMVAVQGRNTAGRQYGRDIELEIDKAAGTFLNSVWPH